MDYDYIDCLRCAELRAKLAEKGRDLTAEREKVSELRTNIVATRDMLQAERERSAALVELVESIRDNWDCDTGANGAHPHYCRKCSAARALAAHGGGQ